jgi:sugar phosphate isomerase/epimerase
MKTSRRTFIQNSSLTVASAAILPNMLYAEEKKDKDIVGVQLYIVRNDMKNNPADTLKKLKEIGYEYVEHAGYENRKFYGYTREDFKKLLSDTGLKMHSGHSNLGATQWDKTKKDFTDEWKYTFDDAAKVGMKYVLSPGVDEDVCKNMDDFKWYMDLFNKAGELAKKAGVTFGYHSESYEFSHTLDNIRLYDLLLKLTDPSLVAQQIDIGNMYAPGGKAMDYLTRYKGRFALMHVKDAKKKASGDGYESTPLGTGLVDVKEAIDFARDFGTKYFIIEEAPSQNQTALDACKENLKIMKGWGF